MVLSTEFENLSKLKRMEYIRPKSGYFKNKNDILKTYCNKLNIPLNSMYLNELLIRDKFIEKGIYALITEDFLDNLSCFFEDKKVLEIMGGRGYLAKGLLDRGVNLKVTDDMSWKEKLGWSKGYTKIEKLDALSAVIKYGRKCDYILLSWSPYEVNIDYEVLCLMRKINPLCKIVVIGEGPGGCTGSDDFHKNMKRVNEQCSGILNNSFDNWDCIHDHVYIVK